MKAKNCLPTTITIALLSLLSACGQKTNQDTRLTEPIAASPAAAPLPSEEKRSDAKMVLAGKLERSGAITANTGIASKTQAISSSAASYTDGQHQFIRTAHASFSVKNVYQSAVIMEDIVATQGGFVVRNEISADVQKTLRRPIGEGKLLELSEYVVHGNLTVRVPSDKTQAFLRAIVDQMVFLDQRSFSAEDAQFDLLAQQLAYKRNQETQEELEQASQNNGRISQKVDAITSQNEAKADRDQALVNKKVFEDKIAFSEINLTIYQPAQVRQTELSDTNALFEQNSEGVGTRFLAALRTGWYGTLNLLIALSQLWPLCLGISLAALAWRRHRKTQVRQNKV